MLSALSVIGQMDERHNNSADAYFVNESERFVRGGVFEGCPSGVKPHWASQTFAYLFGGSANPLSDSTMMSVYYELVGIKSRMGLGIEHFKSSCLLFEYAKVTKELSVRVFGAGIYFVNDCEIMTDRRNRMDYFGNYIGDREKFMEYLNRNLVMTYRGVDNFQMCSYGIKGIAEHDPFDDTNPLSVLFSKPTSEMFLEQAWWRLKEKKHFRARCDMTILSYSHFDERIKEMS